MRIIQDEKTGKISCDFNPTENEIVDRLYGLVNDVAKIAKCFPRPQNEIMTLLDLEAGSLLPLNESIQSVRAADELLQTSRDSIKRVVESALKRPREILEEYLELASHAFSSSSVQQFLDDWDERDPAPSMEELTSTVRAYYETSSRALHDHYDVIYSSDNEEASSGLFTIDIQKMKRDISDRARAIGQGLMRRVVERTSLSLELYHLYIIATHAHPHSLRYTTKQRYDRAKLQGNDLETRCDARERGRAQGICEIYQRGYQSST